MTRQLRAVLFASFFVAVSAQAGVADERPRGEAPRACASANVAVDEVNQKVIVSFSNRCAQKVSCAVSWGLRCGHGAMEAKGDLVSIDGHAESQLEASASSCGDGDWRITPPRWRCDEPSAPVEQLTAQKPRTHRR